MLTAPGNNQHTNFFSQNDFSGGMRRNVDPASLQANEYALLINGRNRYSTIRTIKLPANVTNKLPTGNYQGLYGYGKYLIAFIDGCAYVRDFSATNSQFFQLVGFQMDAYVPTIYAEAVEASWMNYQRRQETANQANSNVNLFTNVAGTPSCLVCQDGINRPMLIFPDGNARQAKTFGEWQNTTDANSDNREYVPVGKQMLNFDGILYIVSADGTQIYRSVTGRFLDFVIAIDTKGDKLSPLQNSGEEAARLSYRVDFNPITCIAALPSIPINPQQGAGFYVGTSQTSYIVIPNYADTIYGEPTFSKQTLFDTGPLNQFSVADISGDTAVIDAAGMVSFNAVLQLRNEGRNAPFHDEIHDLFKDITQTTTAAYTFDNYALFGVDTVFGPGILVYDTMRKKYVSFDQYPDVNGYIVQFAEIKVNGIHKLFFRTSTNQLFEAYGSNTTATTSLYTREMSVENDPEIEATPKRLRLVFEDVLESGTVNATEYVDRKVGITRTINVNVTVTPPTPPLIPPFGLPSDVDRTLVKSIPFELSRKGSKCGLWIQWSMDCDLVKFVLVQEAERGIVTEEEQGTQFADSKGTL
jgi:hypothetical protein